MFLKNLPLKLSIPRTRSSNFSPSSIPKYKRFLSDEYENLVGSLILSSQSIESLKESIKEMNIPISEAMIERLSGEFQEYMSRELDPDWLFIFIDAKEIEVKEGGKKEIMDSRIFEGRENLNKWRE